MKIYLLLLFLSTTSSLNYNRRYTPSFLRDSVEKITNYPFKTKPLVANARRDDTDIDQLLYDYHGSKKSYLIDYVFRSFGSRNLPLREAVESLPVPLLTSEKRSFPAAGRLPLRDAVEHSTAGEQWNSPQDYSEEQNFFPYNRNSKQQNHRRGRNYNFEINYSPYTQFDPTRHELLTYKINNFQRYNQLNTFNPYENRSFVGAGTLFDDDTIEVLGPELERPQPVNNIYDNHYHNWLRGNDGSNDVRHDGSFHQNEQQYKLVCYLQGWANYRKDPMKFNTFNIDPFACTHIIYAYAGIDPHTYTIYPQNEEHDVVQGGYRSVVGLKRYNPHLKVLISIAGWSTKDSKFSTMTSSAAKRQKFIKSVARFLDAYHFDGVDLDWEFPGAEDLGGHRNDREHFSLLLEELAEVFLLKNWLLSAAVAPSRFRIEDGYNVRQIAPYLDLINVLAFDLHSEREEVADHHSPLYRRQHDQGLDIFYNADYAMQYWIKKGAPREKLILGIPFFGRSFTLSNPQRWLPGSDIWGLGKEGPFTQDKGFLAYFEICEMIAQGNWKTNTDSVGSPYAVKGDQWVGYDDTRSVLNKVNYVKKQRLGGAALYAIDLDDYQGACGSKWPLLSTARNALLNSKPIKQEVLSPPGSRPPAVPVPGSVIVKPEHTNCSGQGYTRDMYDCRVYHRCEWGWKTSYMCPEYLHFDESLDLCNWPEHARCKIKSDYTEQNEIQGKAADDEDYKIVCYFTNWAWYRKGDGKFVPEHIDPRLCTHIVYAYASLDPNELTMKPFDVTADIDNSFYDRVTKLQNLRNKHGRPKILLALGGWTDSTGNKYSKLVSDMSARKTFVSSAVNYLKKYKFQGLHFDWIYPKCWQSDCNKGPDSDLKNFAHLLQELKEEFEKQSPPLILAAGISGYRDVIDVAYDVAKISRTVDFMSVMTYDYHGAWEKKTGHVSPLYYRQGDSFPRFNTNYTLEYLTIKGADRSKLLMGIPFYGQSYTLKSKNKNGYGAPAEGPGTPGEFTKQPGMLSYYEICDKIRSKKWQVSKDPQQTTGPFAFKDTQWVSYDDADMIKQKAMYIKDMGYGGAMAWTIDLDDFNNRCCQGQFPLLKTLGRELGHITDEEPVGSDCTRPIPPVTPPPPVTTTGVDSGGGHEHEHEHTTWPTWTQPTTSIPSTTVRPPTWKPTTTTTTTRKPSTTSTTTTTTTTTTMRPSTTTMTTTTFTDIDDTDDTVVEEAITIDDCEPGKYYPDTKNCNAYYRCILGELQKQYCIVGLHWNSDTNNCDWPENAKCDKENYVTRPTPTTISTTPDVPNDFPPSTTGSWWTTIRTTTTTTMSPIQTTEGSLPEFCTNGMYYPVPESCNQFAICVNGVLVIQSCAPGLHWNQNQQICDWSHNVPCGSSLNSQNSFDSLNSQNSLNKQFDFIQIELNVLSQPCQEGSYANYPGNCNQYLSCLWGTYAVFSCAPGLHWNNAERICDWPHRANCDPNISGGGGGVGGGGGGGIIEQPEVPEQPDGENEITGGGIITEPPTQPKPPTTQAPVTTAPPSAQSGYFKIVCYFTNWAWYRQGAGKYLPENIDPNLCTHIVYGFAVLDYENLIIKAHDSWADFDNKFYERVVAYKKKGLKVTLAIGGWNDSQGDKYSRLVNSPAYRKKFINHVIQFLQKYGFDGLDLDWEYPKCWQVDCNKGPDSDKAAFSAFVKELHDAFQPHGLLLSAAVSPSKTVVDAGYDVPALGQYLDWVSVMTYDYHGQWDKKTGHVAPMYFHEDDEFYFFNANYSINYWISEGVPRRKIIMGMPLYGQSFQLANPSNNGLNANAPGPGQAGEFTRAAGFLAYYEICERIQNRGWTVVKDPMKRMGPYAYKGNQWVSFDDVETIKMKSEYIRQMDLGGGMIWALDLDDFKNKCGGGKHPLLSTIRNILGPAPNDNDMTTPQGPDRPPAGITTERPMRPPGGQFPGTTTKPIVQPGPGTTTSEKPSGAPPSEEEFKVVCYFTNWAWYRQGLGKYLPSDIDPDLCTHIIYGFAVLNGDQGIIKPHDTWADFDNKFYEKVTSFKKRGIKVLIAIGGWNDSAGDKYSRLVNNPSARAKFISHVIEFIEKHNFDGLDLDWEYPKCWQVNCKLGPDSDKPSFADFVRELKAAFQPRGLLLSAAVSPSKRVIDAGYDVVALSEYLDWISVMTYDFHGQWDKVTGHIAPMYLHADDVDVTFHANYSINYWISEGADRKKIVMGLPMYGQSFSLANVQENGLNAPTYGGGEAGEFTRARGFLSYYEICHNIREKKWKVVRDRKGRMGPYAYLRDQWVSFDDQEMIKHKAEYIRYMGLGGGMIWALDLDDFKNRCQCETYPLLKTINRVLRNYPGPQPVCVLDGKENEIIPERPGFGETPPPTSSEPEPITDRPTTQTTMVTRPTTQTTMITRPTTQPPRPTRPTTQMPTTQPTPPQDLDCRGKMFGPHPNCNKYYLCIHGKFHEMNCPPGLHWNKNHCDWPQNSGCKSAVTSEDFTTTTKPTTTSTTTTKRPMWTTMTTKKPTSMWSTTRQTTTTESYEPESTTSITTPNSEYKVVCYFTNWAWYRPGIGKYTPENIDYELCTHIAYGFAVLDPNTLQIKPHDSWADIDNEFYIKVTNLKKKGLKVLIAIGGWNDSLGNKYSRLVGNPQSRRKFIETVIQFIQKYNFDGLDLDWEYPKCWQVNCDAGPAEDKENFATFVEELSKAFKPKGWLLSSAVSPSKVVIDLGYEVAKLSRFFDYISVMTYDFHGHWDKQTGHVAPLYYYPGDTYDYFNANYSINYWIEKGADRRKIIMGVPLYGQSFQLQNANEHGLNAPSSGPGQAGEFTRAGGFLSFYEICEYVKRQGWKVTRDPMGRIGPYAYKGNQWVSYDDVDEIRRKAQFIKQMGLGGGMIWALDLDDFRNRCGCGNHPLLKTLNQELRGIGGQFSDCT